MVYRTRYQREVAVSALLRDLTLRTTNVVLQEYCDLCLTLLGGPPGHRKAIEPRVAELIASAEERKQRVEEKTK